ncbi:unnamed protein product [Closterium sp. Yama58-4]|nr:unnamed protein product [Closterium sp. Yama58-4]
MKDPGRHSIPKFCRVSGRMAAVRRTAVAATRLLDCVAAVAASGRHHMIAVDFSSHSISDKGISRDYHIAPISAPSNLIRCSSSSVAPSSSPHDAPCFSESQSTRRNYPAGLFHGALFRRTTGARRFHPPRPAAFLSAISPISARGIAGSSASSAEPVGRAEEGGGGHAILELKLAQTGEGIAECELLQWFVEEGEEVRAFQRVCQVQSDKATVDITSRFHGRILRTHFMPGDVVKVGETLADILPPGAGEPVATSAPPPHDTSSEPQSSSASSTSSSSATSPSRADQSHEVLAVPAVRHLARTHGINLADVEGTGRDGRVTKEDVLAYVQSRQGVEEEMRMEEHVLEGPEPAMGDTLGAGGAAGGAAGGGAAGGGGGGGVLVGGGVEAGAGEAVGRMGVAAAAAQAEGVGAGAGARARVDDTNDILLPMRGYRRAMAKAMAAALAVPHFTFMDEVSMDAALSLRSQLNSASSSAAAAAAAAAAGGSAAKPAADKAGAGGGAAAAVVRLTHLPILVKALSVALHDYPTLNSTLDDASFTHLRCKRAHNIGIAMATPSGLVVPNIKNCQSKSIPQIAEDIARLRRLALLNQLPNEDVTGGTISISNIGSIGGTYATPLVHLPEVAIVALGRVHTMPRFDAHGNVVPVALMNVSWSADHRVIDGATLAAFSSHWKSFIECPTNLLLHLM